MRFKAGEVIADKPSWWLYGERNQVVAWAGDTYGDLTAAQRAAETFQYAAARAKFELYRDRSGHWRWRALLADQKVASSSESFGSEIAARRAANAIRDNVASATLNSENPHALRRTAH